MVRYHSLQKRGFIRRHCNVFDPEKALRHNIFFLQFCEGNTIPYRTPKLALKALHLLMQILGFYVGRELH